MTNIEQYSTNRDWEGRSNGASSRANEVSDDASSLDMAVLWRVMRRRKWVIIGTTLVVIGVVLGYTLQQKSIYEADSIVSVNAEQSTVTMPDFSSISPTSLSSQIGVLRNSAQLAERVAERMREAAEALGTRNHYPMLAEDTTQATTRQLVRELMDRVSFDPNETQSMITISAESSSPEEAAAIANFYAEEYKQFSQKKSRERIAAGRKFLEDQLQKREEELQRLEGRWEQFAREKQVVREGEDGERLVEEFRRLQERRDEVQFGLEQERVARNLLKKQLEQATPELEEKVQQERSTSELQSQIDALNQKLGTLRAQAEAYYAVDPERRNTEELKEIEGRIEHFSERKKALTSKLVDQAVGGATTGEGGSLDYVGRLRSRIMEKELAMQELEAQVEELDQRLAAYDGRLERLPRQAMQREQLERKISQAEQWYNSFVQKLQQVRVAEESELGQVRVVRQALVPSVPVRPDPWKNGLLGLLLGLGFGTGLAFLRESSDERLSGPKDVEKQGCELVGVIPSMDREIRESFGGAETVEVKGREMSTSLMTLLEPWSPVAENFRLIRTNLRHQRSNGAMRTLLVTSPEQADGKSVTAVNTAIAMAQAGRRTLLVDGDLRRPCIHRLLGTDRAPGLAELMGGSQGFEPERYQTNIENLSFLPAGHTDIPPAELLDSDKMRNFVTGLRSGYEVVIIDSPPVLAATDALALATTCDAALIVVSSGKTQAPALRATRDKLNAVGARVTGAVINRLDLKEVEGEYGTYEYGYRDTYGPDFNEDL